MVDEKSEAKSKKGVSILLLSVLCLVSVVLGLVGGVLAGPSIKVALGMDAGSAGEVLVDNDLAMNDEGVDKPSRLFEPLPGVFSPDKERFYADIGEFLVAIKYQGRTRYLQLSAQVVGHDEEFMGKVEEDVPALRNGLSIFFTQQDFSAVSTLEGREVLRLATLVEINKIIGATAELRVADVYFTDYITQ